MKKKILILNGPNLNLLGKRNPDVYGNKDFDSFYLELKSAFDSEIELHFNQSNHEGVLIDEIHKYGFSFDGIVINAGGFTHTSVAIRDAIESVTTPVIEVHISNIYSREVFRQTSLISAVCIGQVSGFGLKSYQLALSYFLL